MDSVTATPGRVRSFHGQRLRRVATIPIRTRRRPRPDPVHRPRRQAPQHLALEPRPRGLRAGGARRRRLRDAGLRADRRPEAADRQAALARAAGSTCRPAGATACAACARELAVEADQGQRHDRPGRAPEHLPAVQEHAPAGAAQAPRREPRGPDAAWSPPDTPGTIQDEGTVTGTPFGARLGQARGRRSRTLASPAPSGCSSRRDRSSAPPTLPFTIAGERDRLPRHRALHRRAPAPTAASRAAISRPTTPTRSTARTA